MLFRLLEIFSVFKLLSVQLCRGNSHQALRQMTHGLILAANGNFLSWNGRFQKKIWSRRHSEHHDEILVDFHKLIRRNSEVESHGKFLILRTQRLTHIVYWGTKWNYWIFEFSPHYVELKLIKEAEKNLEYISRNKFDCVKNKNTSIVPSEGIDKHRPRSGSGKFFCLLTLGIKVTLHTITQPIVNMRTKSKDHKQILKRTKGILRYIDWRDINLSKIPVHSMQQFLRPTNTQNTKAASEEKTNQLRQWKDGGGIKLFSSGQYYESSIDDEESDEDSMAVDDSGTDLLLTAAEMDDIHCPEPVEVAATSDALPTLSQYCSMGWFMGNEVNPYHICANIYWLGALYCPNPSLTALTRHRETRQGLRQEAQKLASVLSVTLTVDDLGLDVA